MMLFFKLSGILGLLLISVGILLHKRNYQDILYILGGLFLLIYSISIRDVIFIILQIVFIIAAVYDGASLRAGHILKKITKK